ncbi:YncE family protein [Pedobacter sp. PAMC26386]|nr:YncE family protein [Pedobacter sp. PAMC26386]
MKKQTASCLSLVVLASVFLFSCRKDPQLILEDEIVVQPGPSTPVKGFYLVNEGNMNMNRASLDFMDLQTGVYRRNIYNQANPTVVKGLGDVGNDVGVYGSKLYVVVNISNKVEVMDVKTGKRISQINITNCRYITFHKGKAYVSAYLGTVGDPSAPSGIVAEIDTTSLTEIRRINVGRQPEEMAVVREKLYVANSGGYTPSNYERTVSIIDLNSFQVVNKIDVGVNLHRLKADKYGDLYVTSRGDYYDIPSKLFVIDTKTEKVKKTFDIGVSNLVIDDNSAYFYSSEFSYITGGYVIKYGIIDVKNEVLTDKKFITDGTDKDITIPYGIAVNPYTKDVFITDAKDYVSPGTLYSFDPAGKKRYEVATGDIPAHFAFVY